jgi:hypothetical protein
MFAAASTANSKQETQHDFTQHSPPTRSPSSGGKIPITNIKTIKPKPLQITNSQTINLKKDSNNI